MAIEVMPEWLASLDEEDVSFIKKFVLASGSLKEVAGIYVVMKQEAWLMILVLTF